MRLLYGTNQRVAGFLLFCGNTEWLRDVLVQRVRRMLCPRGDVLCSKYRWIPYEGTLRPNVTVRSYSAWSSGTEWKWENLGEPSPSGHIPAGDRYSASSDQSTALSSGLLVSAQSLLLSHCLYRARPVKEINSRRAPGRTWCLTVTTPLAHYLPTAPKHSATDPVATRPG